MSERRTQKSRSGAGEALVFDLMRLVGIHAQAALLVGLIVLVVALEPFDMAVALEGQHVGGDAGQEPAVMADDHGAAGEVGWGRTLASWPDAPGCARRLTIVPPSSAGRRP